MSLSRKFRSELPQGQCITTHCLMEVLRHRTLLSVNKYRQPSTQFLKPSPVDPLRKESVPQLFLVTRYTSIPCLSRHSRVYRSHWTDKGTTPINLRWPVFRRVQVVLPWIWDGESSSSQFLKHRYKNLTVSVEMVVFKKITEYVHLYKWRLEEVFW